MMARRAGRLSPGRTVTLFVAVAVVSVTALVWMAARLLAQERALEERRLQERREAAADRAAAALGQLLLAEERRLTAPRTSLVPAGEDLLVVVADAARVRVLPENALPYYPVVPATRDAASTLYAEAERLEFVERDHARAIALLRPLTGSRDPGVRAGAELRLARNLRKAGRPDEALAAFGDLARSNGTVSGLPAGLVGTGARCLLLEELRRPDRLREEARALREALTGGHWTLDRDTYLHYAAQTTRWLGQAPPADAGRLALAEAVCWVWDTLHPRSGAQAESAGRRALRFHSTAITILWRASADEVAALLAGPQYQRRHWFEPAFGVSDLGAFRFSVANAGGGTVHGLPPPPGVPTTLRSASVTALPWDIHVTTADPNAALGSFAQRRRVMVFGLALVVASVIAASYFAGRAVSRELRAATLQSDFVSAVSHEFRTPLTSMRQFTEMLAEDDDLPADERRACYAAQERATRRLSRLVESLLDFGRMEAGARPYRRERLDAGELVRTSVEEFRQEGEARGFTVECTVPEREIPIDGDREALAQAVWNLLDNAVKYSGRSRNVCVEVDDNGTVAIRVRDQGLGIAPAERRRIFRKFVRGSSAVQSGIKGTGIGLAMVKHIVDAHGGKVSVESRPGEGSTFAIELPGGRKQGPGTRGQGSGVG